VPAGTTVAIVGRNGSGKTTLAKLLAGLYEPTGGQILYDGVDLTTLDHRELRSHIGYVLQECHLFDETIARNIALSESAPDLERVRWAARVAGAQQFIERLPLGYNTRVGESGLSLSGGQKQRIAIARAVYRRPALLILDEATSALDSESEPAVQNGLDELRRERTCFVIAHRLSTVRDADVIGQGGGRGGGLTPQRSGGIRTLSVGGGLGLGALPAEEEGDPDDHAGEGPQAPAMPWPSWVAIGPGQASATPQPIPKMRAPTTWRSSGRSWVQETGVPVNAARAPRRRTSRRWRRPSPRT
jgi:ABC-type lipoprotein export system ATPase subunit